MKEINDVVILTSCFYPNTKVGPINRKKISFKNQLNDLSKNIRNILQIKFISFIIIIDGSPEKFHSKIKNNFNQLEKSNKIKLIFPSFNQKEKQLVKDNGKGASEIIMLLQARNYAKKISNNSPIRFYKISARYKILNLKQIILQTRKALKTNDVVCKYSDLINQSMTVFFGFNDILDEYLCIKIATQIDDNIGLYIEQIIFNLIISNPFYKTKKILMPIFINNSTISGSHGRRLSYKAQLKQYLATII